MPILSGRRRVVHSNECGRGLGACAIGRPSLDGHPRMPYCSWRNWVQAFIDEIKAKLSVSVGDLRRRCRIDSPRLGLDLSPSRTSSRIRHLLRCGGFGGGALRSARTPILNFLGPSTNMEGRADLRFSDGGQSLDRIRLCPGRRPKFPLKDPLRTCGSFRRCPIYFGAAAKPRIGFSPGASG